MENIIILGAGGFGKEVLQYVLEYCAKHPGSRIKGFLDIDKKKRGSLYMGYEIFGSEDDYLPQDRDLFLVAIGDPRSKKRAAEKLKMAGAEFMTLIHPLAYIAPSARIGKGVIICPYVYVGPDVEVGDFAMLHIYSSCGHDSKIGSYSVLCPYATTNGNVSIGEEVFMATHATVIVGKKVGSNSKLSAGATVVQNIPPNSLAAGSPARWREMFSKSV